MIDYEAIPFQIRDQVKIIPLEREGRIKSIWITEIGVKFEVRYFDNCEAKTIYFYEEELEMI